MVSSHSSAVVEWQHMAYLALAPTAASVGPARLRGERGSSGERHVEPGYEAWLPLCSQSTARVQRLDARHALLDLGRCTPDEARVVARTLLHRLARPGFIARIALGPSLTLAQLALFRHPGPRTGQHADPICLLAPDEVATFLRAVPVRVLPALHPRGEVSAAVVERLDRYGLRTLGHLARIDAQMLRRQFGSVGNMLAAFAVGADPLPLVPTPPMRSLTAEVRFEAPISLALAERALARLAMRLAAHLDGLRVERSITLSGRFEQAGWTSETCLLRAPVRTAREIERELTRLFARFLPQEDGDTSSEEDREGGADAIERLRGCLSGVAPCLPTQEHFWRTREQQHSAVETVAHALARRYGPDVVSYLLPEAPAAIFPEERYTWHPLTVDERAPTVVRSSVATSTQPESAADVWADVPQRLHWW